MRQFTQERLRGPVVVVDVQPAYARYCGHVTQKLMAALVRTRSPVVAVWVGEGITQDDEYAVHEYWRDNGATQALLRRTRFVEKSYGFFRDWMDNGIDDDIIVQTARYLREQRLWASTELDDALLEAVCPQLSQQEAEGVLRAGTIQVPGELEGVRLFDDVRWTTCGGGSNECLKEFELWLASRGVKCERAPAYTY